MATYFDQLGRELIIPLQPNKIISLVPSQTELLFDLGLDSRVVGITRFCIHPADWYKNKTRVGGTKKLNMKKIDALNPDFVVANKEENNKAEIEELQEKYPVYISDINSLTGAIEMIIHLGTITGTEARAQEIAHRIQAAFDLLEVEVKSIKHSPNTAAYLIWKDPYMTAGKGTFIDQMLSFCGFVNVVKETRYPTITLEELRAQQANFIFLSSEPYPFSDKHLAEIEEQLSPAKVILVDGEMFSWYGSRLQHSPTYFRHLLRKLELI